MYPRPTWEPLPDPPGPDPATLAEFQLLAGELMPAVEDSSDAAGTSVVSLVAEATEAETASDALGLDLAASAEELAAMQAEAAPDTLLTELQMAGEQDAAIGVAADDAAGTIPE